MADCVEMDGIPIVESELATTSYVSDEYIIFGTITKSCSELILVSSNVREQTWPMYHQTTLPSGNVLW